MPALGCGVRRSADGLLLLLMMVPSKVRRSTIAARSRGSVKVLVQPPKDSLEAITRLFFS